LDLGIVTVGTVVARESFALDEVPVLFEVLAADPRTFGKANYVVVHELVVTAVAAGEPEILENGIC
jgi:hypothetical protein